LFSSSDFPYNAHKDEPPMIVFWAYFGLFLNHYFINLGWVTVVQLNVIYSTW
jgi:hypothetical protein